MHKVSTFLWFESCAADAADFYVSVLPNTKIIDRNSMSATISIDGQIFILFNGGPHHKLTPAASIFITCEDQKEIDAFWSKLTAGGGQEGRCGWLKDKFGLSWQVVPKGLDEMIKHPKALHEMMQMGKLDIARLQAAAQ